jgi:heme exporter protein B
LISLIALPLYVPTAIFGALSMTHGPGSESAPLFLAASTLFALAVAPFAMAAALRLAAD